MKKLVIIQLICALLFFTLEGLEGLNLLAYDRELIALLALSYIISVLFILFSMRKNKVTLPNLEV